MNDVYLETYQGASSKWYWRLRAGNGRIVADGSEAYAFESGANRAARRVRNLMAVAQIKVSK